MNFYLKLSVFKLIVVLIVLPKCRAVQSPNGDTTISNEPQIMSATAAIEVEAPTVDGNKTFDRLQLRQPHNGSSDNYTYLITGGYQPPQHTLAKYLVSISYGDYTKYYGDNHICGGAIIQPQLIITAAHCLQYITRMPFFTTVEPNIVAGTPNRLQRTHNTQARTGEKQIGHPQYDYFSHRNDIALIFLDSALKLTDYVEVIPLPEAPVAPGTPCTVFGWGRIFEDGPLTAEVLYANVQIWSNALCRTYVPIYVDTAICANNIRDNDVDACSGDSGGPLICDGRLAGIVSFGVGCATPGFPGFYTDVYQFLDWIYDPNTLSGSGKTDVVAVHIVVALAVWWRL